MIICRDMEDIGPVRLRQLRDWDRERSYKNTSVSLRSLELKHCDSPFLMRFAYLPTMGLNTGWSGSVRSRDYERIKTHAEVCCPRSSYIVIVA